MAEKTFDQELAEIENVLGKSGVPESYKAQLRARKEEILNDPQYRYAKAHGLPTAKAPNPVEIQEFNTDYENLANKNIGVLNNTPQAPKDDYLGVDDQKAVGATKEELDNMLQNGQISRAAYEKQIAALHTPEVQEDIAGGEKKADENALDPSKRPDNFQLGDKVAAANELAEPEKGDTKKERAAKNQYKKSAMSIWDAYWNGEFGLDENGNPTEEAKRTAAYFTIDAIATLAKNLGRSIGNVGAQFSGGTIDQGHDESMWEKRRGEMFGEETQLEKESLGGPAGRKAASEIEGVTSQQLANARTSIQNEYTRTQLEQEIAAMEKQLEMAGINISNAESKKAVIDEIKKDKNWASNPLKVIAVSMLAESGTTGITNTAKGIFDSILGLAK